MYRLAKFKRMLQKQMSTVAENTKKKKKRIATDICEQWRVFVPENVETKRERERKGEYKKKRRVKTETTT